VERPQVSDLVDQTAKGSKKSAASKMDAVFKVLLRGARNQITTAFKEFKYG